MITWSDIDSIAQKHRDVGMEGGAQAICKRVGLDGDSVIKGAADELPFAKLPSFIMGIALGIEAARMHHDAPRDNGAHDEFLESLPEAHN